MPPLKRKSDPFRVELFEPGLGGFVPLVVVDQLRIASVGLLDQAEPLSEFLANLTLALDAARRGANAEKAAQALAGKTGRPPQ